MRRRNEHREFVCVAKPSNLNEQQKQIELAVALAILKSLESRKKITAEQNAQCEVKIREMYKSK